MSDEHPIDRRSRLPRAPAIGAQHPLKERLAAGEALRSAWVDCEVKQHPEFMVAIENLGGIAIDLLDTARGVGASVEQIACVDEGVLSGAKPTVVKSILDEFRVAVSIRYDERANRSLLLWRCTGVDKSLLALLYS